MPDGPQLTVEGILLYGNRIVFLIKVEMNILKILFGTVVSIQMIQQVIRISHYFSVSLLKKYAQQQIETMMVMLIQIY